MVTITSAELQRQFGKYRDLARRAPVSVTHHGREDLVMISAEEYNRLKHYDDRQACHPADLPPDVLRALDDALEKLNLVEADDLPETRA